MTRDSSRSVITITIADSNFMASRLLCEQLKRQSAFAVVACVMDHDSLVKSVKQNKCDVALISAELQGGALSGIAALREVHEADAELRPILLCDHPDSQLVVEGFRAGARGVFSRCNFQFATLCKCIRRVREGQVWVGNVEMEYVLNALMQGRPLRVVNPDGISLLSRREEEVMRLVAEGLANREIADLLELSEHTVKNYLFHIFDKLGISNRVELVLYAVTNARKIVPKSTDSAQKSFANSA